MKIQLIPFSHFLIPFMSKMRTPGQPFLLGGVNPDDRHAKNDCGHEAEEALHRNSKNPQKSQPTRISSAIVLHTSGAGS